MVVTKPYKFMRFRAIELNLSHSFALCSLSLSLSLSRYVCIYTYIHLSLCTSLLSEPLWRTTVVNYKRPREASGPALASNAVTWGFKNLRGMALELIYLAENQCASSGGPAGAFPRPPGARLGREAARNRRFSGPPTKNKKNIKTHLTALDLLSCHHPMHCTMPDRKIRHQIEDPFPGLKIGHSAIQGCGCNSCGCNLRWSKVRSGSFAVDLGPVWSRTDPKSTTNELDRTSDNLNLQPHDLYRPVVESRARVKVD
jgi:hypothetical protein